MMWIVCAAFLVSQVAAQDPEPAWNGLKVTWGVNPFDPYVFANVPRTVEEAVDGGWVPLVPLDTCEGGYFKGQRYIRYDDNLKDYDIAVMPIFDVNGVIAGIQGGLPRQSDGWPSDSIVPPFNRDNINGTDVFTMTGYFVDPAVICGQGRTAESLKKQGTGDRLVIQNGPDQLTPIPYFEDDLVVTDWTYGNCITSMGEHYWFNVDGDMSCDDFIPGFILYNNGILNAFGWAYQANENDLHSRRYEHPPAAVLPLFLPADYPKCLDEKAFSTMHIYLTDAPLENNC